MKKVLTIVGFLLCLMLLSGLHGFSQMPDSSYLEYAGSPGGLGRLMLNEVSNSDRLSEEDFYKIHHIYYEVQFRIDKNGTLGEQVIINSVNDTSLRQTILQTMKKTQGHWINHSGKDLLVILPIHLYNDSGDSVFTDSTMKILPVWHASYNRWEETKILYLATIKIKTFPPVHKTTVKINRWSETGRITGQRSGKNIQRIQKDER